MNDDYRVKILWPVSDEFTLRNPDIDPYGKVSSEVVEHRLFTHIIFDTENRHPRNYDEDTHNGWLIDDWKNVVFTRRSGGKHSINAIAVISRIVR